MLDQTAREWLQALYLTTVCENSWLPHQPTPKQAAFLYEMCPEALYGGAAGGGKSESLLTAALQFVDVPGYAAILFRRTYADLSLPGALMDRAKDWLGGTKARWEERSKTWHFPSGATLTFGYLEHEDDKYRYQSSEFQFVGFDELTQFSETQYRYLFSRLRRLKSSRVPVRMRAASNPGGVGHEWVQRRFLVEGRAAGRVFVPARLDDNPHLDKAGYVASLSQLDPITRAQLLAGDWSVRQPGGMFKREWLRLADVAPPGLRLVRSWDLAATEAKPGTDPDWTAGCLMGRAPDGTFYILDIRRVRATPQGVERLILQTAQQDGRGVKIRMEQEGGSAGKSLADRYYSLLAGHQFRAVRATGDKVTRAAPLSSQAEAGRVVLVRGAYVGAFLDEAEAFPQGGHDDQIDAAANALEELTGGAYPAVVGSLICWPPLPGEFDGAEAEAVAERDAGADAPPAGAARQPQRPAARAPQSEWQRLGYGVQSGGRGGDVAAGHESDLQRLVRETADDDDRADGGIWWR